MRFLSLFSGIEAASVALEPLGYECAAVCEFDKAASKLLERRFPGRLNLGDVTKVTEEDIKALGPLDLIIFGSPCQDLSISGKRKGLAGERSGLFFIAHRIIGWARKHCGLRFALWENVPGAFSSNKGRDFAAVVELLAGAGSIDVPANGWGTEGAAVGDDALVEWAVLDAQWFGLAQRRKRVFALADFGNWPCRPPVLLEPQSLRGDHPPRREEGEAVAGTLDARTTAGGFPGTDGAAAGHVQPIRRERVPVVAGALTSAHGPNGHGGSGLATDKGAESGHIQWEVRRLTPTECERLQGFEDGWTDGQADGPRYKQLGNSFAVDVIRWIGQQLQRVEFL